MGLHAFAISTGSVAQGGTDGLDPRLISASGMQLADGPPLNWTSYRILAKARPNEEQHIGLLVTDPGSIVEAFGAPDAYWDQIEPASNVIVSQRGFYLPRWRGSDVESQPQNGTAATSSWQWVQGLDLSIAAYNEGQSAETSYWPGNYGWILGVVKNGTTNGWNVQAWFWGSVDEGGGSDVKGENSFVQVVNSLPTGAYQPAQANDRTFEFGIDAFNAICYSIIDKPNSFDGGAIGNYVVIYNTGSVREDVGVEGGINIMQSSIW